MGTDTHLEQVSAILVKNSGNIGKRDHCFLNQEALPSYQLLITGVTVLLAFFFCLAKTIVRTCLTLSFCAATIDVLVLVYENIVFSKPYSCFFWCFFLGF